MILKLSNLTWEQVKENVLLFLDVYDPEKAEKFRNREQGICSFLNLYATMWYNGNIARTPYLLECGVISYRMTGKAYWQHAGAMKVIYIENDVQVKWNPPLVPPEPDVWQHALDMERNTFSVSVYTDDFPNFTDECRLFYEHLIISGAKFVPTLIGEIYEPS